MEVAEFIEETNRIEKFYEKELDKFQRDEWYKNLKNIPLERYRQIINNIFRKCKFMPKLADIIEMQEELPFQNNSIQKEKVECDKCKGLGLIFYTKQIRDGGKVMDYEFVARCDCKNGEEHAYDGTKIDDVQHRSKYYIPLISQLGL